MQRVTQDEAIAHLDGMGAIREGHFIGTSDRHLSAYIQKDLPTSYPRALRGLAGGIANLLNLHNVDVIASPPMGALLLGGMVAEELGCRYVYLERISDEELAVKRSLYQQTIDGKRVGIVEDIFTSGKTSKQSIAAVRKAGGKVVCVSGLYNRGGVTGEELDVPNFVPLITKRLPDWDNELSCELCAKGVPIVLDIGHGQKFRDEHPDFDIGYMTMLS